MTLPFDKLMGLIEKAPANARGIFADWASIDPELKASYAYDTWSVQHGAYVEGVISV